MGGSIGVEDTRHVAEFRFQGADTVMKSGEP